MDIRINIDRLTLGDLERFEELQGGGASIKSTLDLLDKFVQADVPLRSLPITAMRDIVDAVQEAIQGITNPKN